MKYLYFKLHKRHISMVFYQFTHKQFIYLRNCFAFPVEFLGGSHTCNPKSRAAPCSYHLASKLREQKWCHCLLDSTPKAIPSRRAFSYQCSFVWRKQLAVLFAWPLKHKAQLSHSLPRIHKVPPLHWYKKDELPMWSPLLCLMSLMNSALALSPNPSLFSAMVTQLALQSSVHQ